MPSESPIVKLPGSLVAYPHIAKTTMAEADLKSLLLSTDGWVMLHGRIWDLKSEAIGAGVYKVWLERRE